MTDKEYSLIRALHDLGNEYNALCQDPIYLKAASWHKFLSLVKIKDYKSIRTRLFTRVKHIFKKPKFILDKSVNNDVIPPFGKDTYDLSSKYERAPKIIVYSHISKGYDAVKDPIFYNPDYDYVLFTDMDTVIENKSSVWTYKEIPEQLKGLGNILINRYIKLHPAEMFPDYDFAIYIDGSIRIISDITPLLHTTIMSKAGLGLHNHMFRDCVYSEGVTCIDAKRGSAEKILQQMQKYREEGLPSHFGLFEATVIVTDLHNPISKDLLNSWYDEFCNSNSLRDQLALPYVIWKKGYTKEDIGFLGDNLRRNPMFRWYSHE